MAGIMQRIRSWWNRDRTELVDEESEMSDREREMLDEEYESRKDDQALGGYYPAGGMADFERDSERPR